MQQEREPDLDELMDDDDGHDFDDPEALDDLVDDEEELDLDER